MTMDNDDDGAAGSDDGAEARIAIEAEAKALGWVPKEKFVGPANRWRDAEEFVSRGHDILPIVRANNARLLEDLQAAKSQLASLKGTVDQQAQTVKDLLTHQADEIKRQVQSKIADLRTAKRAAIKDGDHDLAADLEEEIDTTKDELAKVNSPAADPPKKAATTFQGREIPPDVEPWAAEFATNNSDWLQKDKRKTSLFMGICDDLYTSTSLRGKALLDEGKRQTEETLSPRTGKAAKSESGSGSWSGSNGDGSSSRSTGSSFSDLPPEAKQVCKKQEGKFVGTGKAFKDTASWQKHYADTYFASSKV